MPSSNNLIQSLRSAHDPHFKLEGRVGGLEKGLGIQVAQLHKTLSKSFAMQRKTLVRVLGLEKRVAELEAAKAAVQEAAEQIEEEVGDEIPEGLDDILDDVRGEKEVGATATKTKPKTKKKPKIKSKKRKIKGKDLGFKSRVMGTDNKGGYLSGAERKKQFLQGKLATTENKFSSADIGEDEGKKDRIVQFLNVDVKDKLDDINQSATEIKDILVTSGDLADDRDEALRQSILSDRKKEREKNLEKKKGVKEKMLETVTKPVGNFLNKLIKFVMMTFVGSVINRVMTLLKDPAQFLDPIKRFFNLIIGLVNSVMKGLWNITGAPMNFIIGGINKGVSSLLDAINKATGLLKIPAIPAPQIPLIPGPPEVQFIPLSKTAQEKNEAVAMAGGGVVPGSSSEMSSKQQIMRQTDSVGTFGEAGSSISTSQATPEEMKEKLAAMGMPSMELWDGSVVPNFGKMGADSFMQGIQMVREGMTEHPDKIKILDDFMATNPYAQPEKLQSMINRVVPGSTEQVLGDMGDSITASAKMNGGGLVKNLNVRRQGFSGGGIVPGPYPTTNLLGMGHNVINTAPNNIMGYNKGGKVPGQGEGDTVPAMLTPGEFVMSKGAVDQIGSDKLMAMNAAGGGTNQPKMMKFAGGGMVPEIGTPNKKGGGVVVIGGGGGSKSSGGVQSYGDSGTGTPQFSSSDPNNITIPVVKSLYNIMS